MSRTSGVGSILTMTEKVYLAGAIQHASDHGKGWRQRVKNNYGKFGWLDPLDKYDSTKSFDNISDEWTNAEIVEGDLELIEESDALLVHWREVPSCGTPMEIVYAVQVFEIPVVVQTTVAEPSIWLLEHADAVVETFDEAIEALEEYIDLYSVPAHA